MGIAYHQKSLGMHVMVAAEVVVEEQRHREKGLTVSNLAVTAPLKLKPYWMIDLGEEPRCQRSPVRGVNQQA